MPLLKELNVLDATTFLRRALLALCCLDNAAVCSREAAPTSDDPVSARDERLLPELRCPVCQNQTIADSHADLAGSAQRVRDMLRQWQERGRDFPPT